MEKYKIINASKLAKDSPYTFYIPSKKRINNLTIGDFVKIIFKSTKYESDIERMWVEIININNKDYVGKLVNNPKFIDIKLGNQVNFQAVDIINIENKDSNLESNKKPDILKTFCIVSKSVLISHNVGYLYKEDTDDKNDSGWRILTGDETDDYLDNDENFEYHPIGSVLNINDSFLNLLNAEVGSHFIRNYKLKSWESI